MWFLICISAIVFIAAIVFAILGRDIKDGLVVLFGGAFLGLIICIVAFTISSFVLKTPLVETERIMINDASEFRVQPYIDFNDPENKWILVRVNDTSTSAMEYIDLITISGDSFYVVKRIYHRDRSFFGWAEDYTRYDLNIPAKAFHSFR